MNVTLAEQIECVQRELKMRRRVYANWVAEGKMTQVFAHRQIAAMEAVERTLESLLPPPPQGDLLAGESDAAH